MRQEAALAYPRLNIDHLDTLWLQVTGTLCNLACLHCFISCGPKNQSHEMMSQAQVEEAVAWGAQHGVRDYYFTGGEPFMHPEIRALIEHTLSQGPLSILSNGLLITDGMAAWLGELARRSSYSLDLRISLDGTTAEENDPIRGRHTFHRILAAVERLVAAGINPVITVTTCHAELSSEQGRLRFIELLKAHGIHKPRLKFLAPLKIGREANRRGGAGAYSASERLYLDDLPDPDEGGHLLCASSRTVTERGVYPCPILIERAEARMGDQLDAALRPITLNASACYTCHVEGMSCRT